MLGHGLPCECQSLVNVVSVWQAISDWAKSRTLQQQRQFLPVYDCREELLQVIRENQVVVVVGETGSGKTTQVCLPQLFTVLSIAEIDTQNTDNCILASMCCTVFTNRTALFAHDIHLQLQHSLQMTQYLIKIGSFS